METLIQRFVLYHAVEEAQYLKPFRGITTITHGPTSDIFIYRLEKDAREIGSFIIVLLTGLFQFAVTLLAHVFGIQRFQILY